MINHDRFRLSKREIEILALLAEGASNQDISKLLFIKPNTTKSHILPHPLDWVHYLSFNNS